MKKNRDLKKRLSLLAVRPLMWLHTALSWDVEQHSQWKQRIRQIETPPRKLLGSGDSWGVPATRSEQSLDSRQRKDRPGVALLRTAMVGSFVLAAAVMSYETFQPPQITTVQTAEIQVVPDAVEVSPYVQPSKAAVEHAIQGYYFQINKQYDSALAEYQEALDLHENYPDVHWNKALIHHQLEQFSDAIDSYQAMLRMNPNDTDALYNMGYAMDKLGQYGEALGVYEQILQVDPSDIHAPVGKGIAYYHLNQFDAAITEFVKVIDTNPKYAYYNLACMFSVKGEPEQAFQFLEKALPYMDQEMMEWAKQDPDFDAIRNDPRFDELVFGT